MDMKAYKKKYGRKSLDSLAVSIGSSSAYLDQLASGHRLPSVKFCRKLVAATQGELSFMDLRPDIYVDFAA